MPSIKDSLISNINLAGLVPDGPRPVESVEPKVQRNMFCRCPVPQITNVSSDTIAQSYLRGMIPQFRVWINK